MKRQLSCSKSSKKTLNDSASFVSSDGLEDGFDNERDDTKRKSRNLSEKKRRDQFNVLINELCTMVYDDNTGSAADVISGLANSRKMDKSSVLRSTIDFLKHHSELIANQAAKEAESKCDQDQEPATVVDSTQGNNWRPSSLSQDEFAQLMIEAMDAFILVIEANSVGGIVYASESISPLLGYHPGKLTANSGHWSPFCPNDTGSLDDQTMLDQSQQSQGTSIFDYLHESDKESLRQLLDTSCDRDAQLDQFQSVMLHFKQNGHRSYSVHELVRLLGSFYSIVDPVSGTGNEMNCFVSIGRLQVPKLMKELRMAAPHVPDCPQNGEFVSRHSMEWKFLFLDHRASALIGYMPFEVLGTSGFDYYHWDDLERVIQGHDQLMQTGEGTSPPYRFLTKGQQWIWLRTRSYITYHQWNSKPEFIVCTHTIMGHDDDSLPELTSSGVTESPECKTTSMGSSSSLASTPSNGSSSQPSSSQVELCQKRSNVKFRYRSYTDTETLASAFSSSEAQDSCTADQGSSPRTIKSRLTELQNVNQPEMAKTGSLSPPSNLLLELEPYVVTQCHRQKSSSSLSLNNQVQAKNQFHDYLRKKHHQLLRNISQQQDELKRVSRQLDQIQFPGVDSAGDDNSTANHSHAGHSSMTIMSTSDTVGQQFVDGPVQWDNQTVNQGQSQIAFNNDFNENNST
ncbi:Circadian locomoter output cycles protein kaput [Halotydeus destructor]|nr:Circadian locomoter output cycles protein kaput [Halotydeus destructor]